MKITKEAEDENTKTEDTTTSSSSSKKFKRNKKNDSPRIKYSIKENNLPSIKEENSGSKEKNSESFNLILGNDNNNENYLDLIRNNFNVDDFDKNKIEQENNNNNQFNQELNSQSEEKSAEKNYKKKQENFIDLTGCEFKKDDDNNIENNSKKSKSSKKSKKDSNSEIKEFSRVNSKNKIDLKFLDEEEKSEEQIGDYNIYIQRAYDEEEEFKIIYEFNKLPFKPKVEIIDLGVFDNTSIFKCIIKCYFDKVTQNFITKYFFVYVSDQSSLSNEKNITEKILDYFNKKENENNEEKNDLGNSYENNKENEIIEDIQSDEDTIGLSIQLIKFKINKGKERYGDRRQIKIKKSEEFKEINGETEIIAKEDLNNYLNYHKIFYIVTIKKMIFIKSKRFFSPKKIGIQNEGNTCYMNSIIQSLYNNPFMLKQIMQIDPEKNEQLLKEENQIDKKVIEALQKIFYNLYTCKKPIKILEIFYAFNWKRNFWNSPQDAEEIYIMIFEILSKYNFEIKNNCEGILENTIKVADVNYESLKEENFFFMQLDIEKNNSVDECLEHFFEIEQLNGENKYQYINSKEKAILCDAEKYYKFKKIPNFLFLQLKRFTFDTTTFNFEKKNKAISYKEEIDLTKYFHNKNNNSKSKKNKNTEKEIYTLYSVLVHSGSADNGHYYCIARDFKNKVYIKYNDTSIFTAEKKEIFGQLFGGEEIEYTIENINKNKYKEEPWYEVKDKKIEIKRNAYLLIYVKKTEIKNLFDEEGIKNIFDQFSEKIKSYDDTTFYPANKEKDKKINDYLPVNKYLLRNNRNSYNDKNFKGFSKDRNNKKTYKRNTYKDNGIINFTINEMDKYKCENINNTSNNKYDGKINMKENNFDYSEMCQKMNEKSYNQKRTLKDLKNGKSKTFYNYVPNGNSHKQNPKKIDLNFLSGNNYKKEKENIGNKYYLIPDISTRYNGDFLKEYNSPIFVRDVVPTIKEIMGNLKNIEKEFNILKKITESNGYKLVLINSFGFFIKFLDEENYEITNLLKYNNPKNLKHLCLYDFEKLKSKQEITNLFAIHFIQKSTLEMIVNKKDIYENYSFDNINVPAFLINEIIENKQHLIDRIKDLYVNYFGSRASKIEFKIYIIKDSDIMDKKVTDINYIDLDADTNNFILYVDSNSSSARGYGTQKYNTRRLLIGI